MKTTFKGLLSLFIALSVLFGVGCEGEEPAVSYSVENFTVLDENLSEVELWDFVGKPTVLNFWATWCKYCVYEMPDFEEAYIANPNVQFMMINHTDGKSETVEKAAEFIESNGYSFPVFYDTMLTASEKYNIEAFPMTFFISREGEVVKTHRGRISAQKLNEYILLITE